MGIWIVPNLGQLQSVLLLFTSFGEHSVNFCGVERKSMDTVIGMDISA